MSVTLPAWHAFPKVTICPDPNETSPPQLSSPGVEALELSWFLESSPFCWKKCDPHQSWRFFFLGTFFFEQKQMHVKNIDAVYFVFGCLFLNMGGSVVMRWSDGLYCPWFCQVLEIWPLLNFPSILKNITVIECWATYSNISDVAKDEHLKDRRSFIGEKFAMFRTWNAHTEMGGSRDRESATSVDKDVGSTNYTETGTANMQTMGGQIHVT